MSRSGYTDDYDLENWDVIRWRGAVKSAVRGKRGQQFLLELLVALDAMPNKRLILNELKDERGEFCALGVVAEARGLDTDTLDSEEHEIMADTMGVARALICEIEWANDEGGLHSETPEARHTRVRAWVAKMVGHNA